MLSCIYNLLGIACNMLNLGCMVSSSCTYQIVIKIYSINGNEVFFSVSVSDNIPGFVKTNSVSVDVSFKALVWELSLFGFILNYLNNVSDHGCFVGVYRINVVIVVQVISILQCRLKNWLNRGRVVLTVIFIEPDLSLTLGVESDHFIIHIEGTSFLI